MSLRHLLTTFLFLTTLVPLSAAQICRPDRLDGGPCCAVAQPDIPILKSFTQGSNDICWRDCGIEAILNCKVRWIFPNLSSTPVPPNPCDPQPGRLRIMGPGGVLKWTGRIVAQYSRSWDEIDTAGNQLQVWRFLVNGELSPTTTAGPIPCPVPPCAPAFNNLVRFTGYLDLAEDCATGVQQRAWMLTHACDLVDHAPGFPRAGVFHPDRSYTFVGPAAGFVATSLTPIAAGGGPFDAMRSVAGPIPGTIFGQSCLFEERIQSFLNPITSFCLCGPATAIPQYQISNLGVFSSCGSTVTTPGAPFLPGYVSMGIGTWTNPLVFPGVESLRWTCGGYDHFDACNGITRQEVYFGVLTEGGFPASIVDITGVTIPLPPFFVDQSNSIRFGATIMNVPYLSEHFLNLNF